MQGLNNFNKNLPNIIVFGGTGFVGSNLIKKMINKHNLNTKFNIIIPSSKSSINQIANIPNVHYLPNINVFESNSLNDLMNVKNTKFIIHSIGTFNNDMNYKNLVKNVNIFYSVPILIKTFLKKILNDKNQNDDINFIKYNYSSFQKLLESIKERKTNKPSILYLSANRSCITDKDYIKTKRMAEKLLEMKTFSKKLSNSIIYRPGVMFTDLYKNKMDLFLKNMIWSSNGVSIRDVMSLLISNNLVINRDEYFTNVDSLTDRMIEDIIKESEKKNETYEIEIVDKTKFLNNQI
ncbi:uncharacterized protein HGUI_04013 [Hanseniaspora guilliermondii]|uniref:NAD-dependent epimerase/dehydratase domain-containing protein n=1 Tax=Hanseniaspora guilliermondii TaxID=56406 RepID=A0A1L0B7K4_9ASCO|nr:uncharacterized protein HGUI_04013 [Hanseniaspora guilliermondii]